jgi:hypothetical protein
LVEFGIFWCSGVEFVDFLVFWCRVHGFSGVLVSS